MSQETRENANTTKKHLEAAEKHLQSAEQSAGGTKDPGLHKKVSIIKETVIETRKELEKKLGKVGN